MTAEQSQPLTPYASRGGEIEGSFGFQPCGNGAPAPYSPDTPSLRDRDCRAVGAPGAPETARRTDHCTCRYGRDFDGCEFGPCAYCEHVADEEAALKSLTRDAFRWRLTQRPGYFVNRSYEFSDTESNVVVVYLGGEKAGCGRTVQEAVDCALYLTAEHGDKVPFAALLGHWRRHYHSRFDGKHWVKPPAPIFELGDDGEVYLKADCAEGFPS